MDENVGKGKRRRRYDASGRQAQAHQQHESTLTVARQLFLTGGYVATTVEAIAKAAGMSAATIYKTYGGKAGLVRELCERALSGAGPVPAEERSDALRAGENVRGLIDGWGGLAAEVSPRVSPLLLLLRTAAETDREAAALHAELDATRLVRMAENARYLVDRGYLRPGVSGDDARDVLWACTSPELYDLLVQRRGWTVERFGRFIADTMSGTLL